MEPALRLDAVSVSFGNRLALDQVSLVVRPGEMVGLVGSSGAGKSTLLGVAGGSVRPSAGMALTLGGDLSVMGARSARAVWRRVGTIHQGLDLVGPLRAANNVMAGSLNRRRASTVAMAMLSGRYDSEVEEALARVGMGGRGHERTELLSGGEQQRLALARVLVGAPELVLADEPVSSLDPAWAEQVLLVLRSLTTGPAPAAVVVSLHHPALAVAHCHRVLGLRAGSVAFDLPSVLCDSDRLADVYAFASSPDGGPDRTIR
ncbi:MAG: phosphonate ABC transporter ATP-binding protein [Acidimicrobiales bacterium]